MKIYLHCERRKDFSRVKKYGEISFYPLETNKTTFFVLKIESVKRQISKSEDLGYPSGAHHLHSFAFNGYCIKSINVFQ